MATLILIFYICLFVYLMAFLLWKTAQVGEKKIKDCGEGIFGSIYLVKKGYGEIWLRMCGVAQGVDARTFIDTKSYWHVSAEEIAKQVKQRTKNYKDCSILYLGLGGGTIPALVAKKIPAVRQVVIEIDPNIIGIVKEDFGLKDISSIEIRQADAFELVKNNFHFGELFDIVFIDVFSDLSSLEDPGSIEREFFRYYHGLLKENGVLMVNQPFHSSKARQSVSNAVALLESEYGKTEIIYVHDKKRNFRNALIIV